MKVSVSLSIGFPTAVRTDVLDIEGWEDMDEVERDEYVNEWAWQYIEITQVPEDKT